MKPLILPLDDDLESLQLTVVEMRNQCHDISIGVDKFKTLNKNLQNHNQALARKITQLEDILRQTKGFMQTLDKRLEILEDAFISQKRNKA